MHSSFSLNSLVYYYLISNSQYIAYINTEQNLGIILFLNEKEKFLFLIKFRRNKRNFKKNMSPPTAKKTKLEAQKPNFELANMLAELADYEKNVNRQIYKYNAYRKAVRSIIDYPVKITSTEDVKNLVT